MSVFSGRVRNFTTCDCSSFIISLTGGVVTVKTFLVFIEGFGTLMLPQGLGWVFAALQVELRQLGTHRASTWVKQWMPLSQKTSPPKRGSRVWFDSLLMHRTCKVIKVGVFLVGYQKPLALYVWRFDFLSMNVFSDRVRNFTTCDCSFLIPLFNWRFYNAESLHFSSLNRLKRWERRCPRLLARILNPYLPLYYLQGDWKPLDYQGRVVCQLQSAAFGKMSPLKGGSRFWFDPLLMHL